jgi:hypothetical protein
LLTNSAPHVAPKKSISPRWRRNISRPVVSLRRRSTASVPQRRCSCLVPPCHTQHRRSSRLTHRLHPEPPLLLSRGAVPRAASPLLPSRVQRWHSMEQSAPPPPGPRTAPTLNGAVSASSRALLPQADVAMLVDVHGITDAPST